jgi:hypothetical protein
VTALMSRPSRSSTGSVADAGARRMCRKRTDPDLAAQLLTPLNRSSGGSMGRFIPRRRESW